MAGRGVRRLWSKWFFYLLTLFICGALHAQQQGAVTYVYTDPQGTPLAEADGQGNITATYDYTPYGTAALGTVPNGPGYTGHVNDPETNLVYMQGRFTTRRQVISLALIRLLSSRGIRSTSIGMTTSTTIRLTTSIRRGSALKIFA
jgi:hypothetical protein